MVTIKTNEVKSSEASSDTDVVLLNEDAMIRTAINLRTKEVYYSAIDVFYILNDYEMRALAKDYWYSTKHRLKGKQFTDKYFECYKVGVMSMDGKRHPTDFLDFDHLFKIIEYCCYAKVVGYGGLRLPQKISGESLRDDEIYIRNLLNKYSTVTRDVEDVNEYKIKSTA